MPQSSKHLKEKNELDLLSLQALASGLLLLALFPIAFWVGFPTYGFGAVFFVHLIVQGVAVALSLRIFFRAIGPEKSGKLLWCALLVVYFLLIILQTTVPITAKDALIHHLALPKMWIEAGRIEEISWHEWSYYPQLLQLGYAGFLRFGLGQLTPLYHFSFLIILAAVGLIFVERRLGSRRLGIWAFLLTISIPMAQRLAGEPLVDLALALYFAIAFALIVEACETEFAGQRVLGAGVALGLALGVKYNAMPAAGLLLLTLPLYCSRKKILFGATLRLTLAIGILAAVFFSPWLIRNYSWTGNPVFPFLQKSDEAGVSGGIKVLANISPLEQRTWLYNESWSDLVSLPIRMIVDGADDDPTRFDGVLSPILLFMFLSVILFRKNPWMLWAGIWITGYTVFSILTASARVRYLAPIWLPSLGLTFVGLQYLRNSRFKVGALISALSLLCHCGFAIWYGYNHLSKRSVFEFLKGNETSSAYLGRTLDEYILIDEINNDLVTVPNARVYLLGTGNRFFYYNVPVYGGHFSEQALEQGIRSSKDTSDILSWVKNSGITHFIVHRERANIALGMTLTESEVELWQEFINKHLREKRSMSGYSFLEVVESTD